MKCAAWATFLVLFFAACLWGAYAYGVLGRFLPRAGDPATNLQPVSLRSDSLGAQAPLVALILGTSLTAGGDWVYELERQLAACRRAGVRVERLAKPGANSAWGAGALQRRLAAGPVPDILIAEFSINDSSLWRGFSLTKSRVHHDDIIATAARAGVPLWLATMTPAFGAKAWQRPGQVAYRTLYADLARQHGVGLVAMAADWAALAPQDRKTMMPDGLHPTDAAMVKLAVPALVRALGPAVCNPA